MSDIIERHLKLLAEFKEARTREHWLDKRVFLRAQAVKDSTQMAPAKRRAYIFNQIINGVPPVIWKDELLLGSWTSIRVFSSDGYTKEKVSEAQRVSQTFPDRNFSTHADHAAVDYKLALQEGIGSLRNSARVHAELFASQGKGDEEQFLYSADEALEGFSSFILGYGRAAMERAEMPDLPEYRRQELKKMAEMCRRISTEPPDSFWEALQLVWFVRLALALEGRYAMAFGRLDQYLYPYYQADINNGRLTKAEASELIHSFFAKLGESELALGFGDVVNIAIGGLTPEGFDGTNDLSYMCLEACGNTKIPTSNLSARFHSGTPRNFYLAAAKVIRTGIGFPAVFNDDVLVESLLRIGIPLEDARDYCMVGCIETFLQGKQAPWSDGRFNLPKSLELALNSGLDMITGAEAGVKTPHPDELATFDELLDAFRVQLKNSLDGYVKYYDEINRSTDPKVAVSPFMSALTRNCIERGRDLNDGGAIYPAYHGIAAMGLATVSDSLAAIKKLVFEEHRYTLSQLVEMLRNDWKGYETEREMIINRLPKYGNDEPYVDEIAGMVAREFCEEVLKKIRPETGGRYVPLIAANISNVYAGYETGATADGRQARKPLSDAASPAHGRDRKGPTSVIRSLTRVDYRNVVGGSVVNQKIDPESLETEEGLARLAALIKTYFDAGGQEMQFNVITLETLKAAKADPDSYRSLVVRVSGFSAFYTTLASDVQDDIINRTTQKV